LEKPAKVALGPASRLPNQILTFQTLKTIPMSSTAPIRFILAEFGIDALEFSIDDKGSNGGYSGGRIWKLTSKSDPNQSYCLKQWPPADAKQSKRQQNQISLINQFLNHVTDSQNPLCILPTPIQSKTGLPWVDKGGRITELQLWIPGRPTFWEDPTDEKLINACRMLARIHQAAESYAPRREHTTNLPPFRKVQNAAINDVPLIGTPPGIDRRIEFIDELNGDLRNRIGQIANRPNRLGLIPKNLLQNFDRLNANLRSELSTLSQLKFKLQFCIRDLWHDHLFFRGEKVSGIVDFGALAIDSVAADLSRMLGSLIGNETSKWQMGLQEYSSIRELSDAERQLISVYDRSTTMLAGMNWLKWILLENRTFESLEPIKERIQRLLNRLAQW